MAIASTTVYKAGTADALAVLVQAAIAAGTIATLSVNYFTYQGTFYAIVSTE